jgi:hypothetical protein
VSTALPSEQGELPFILRREDVAALVGERLARIRSFLARHPGCHSVLSHGSALLAGLAAEFAQATVAAQTAATGNCLSHQGEILAQVDGLYRVRALELGEERGTASGTGERLATHVLYGDRAVPLGMPVSITLADDGVQLANRIDEGAALTVVLRNGSLETVHSAPGTDSSLPPACQPGQAIVVDGHELRLIEVESG